MGRRRAGPPGPAEVLLVDKPAGPTSHDCVDAVRRALGGRAGHAGTLDPFATGLLVILRGPATKVADLLAGTDKRYEFDVQFGAVTASGDPTDPPEPTGAAPVPEAAVVAALEPLRGEIDQRVPRHSAVRQDGERLYRAAHRGETVPEADLPVRRVRVDRLDLLAFDADAQTARLVADCSKGTYVRRLVTDLGQAVGTGAYCLALRRTRIGPLDVADARPLADLPERAALAPFDALAHLPLVPVDADAEAALRRGATVAAPPGTPDGAVRALGAGGLMAVADVADGRIAVRVDLSA